MRNTAAPLTSAQSTIAMTTRPESARNATKGDLTVRSWYRGGRERCRRVTRARRWNTPNRSHAALYRGSVRHADLAASGLVSRLPRGVGAAVVRRGRSVVVGAAPAEVVAVEGGDAFTALDALAPGFWVGWCSFELGHAAERVVARGASTEPAFVPDLVLARFDASAVVGPRGAVEVRGD